MSSSEKSSVAGGADWRWGDCACRCGAESWRGRDVRSLPPPPPPPPPPPSPRPPSICISLADRKSVVSGKSVSVRVDLGGRRIIKKKTIDQLYITMAKIE